MLKGINALDKWLDRSTWQTGHDFDLEIFYRAVKDIIRQNPGVLLHESEISNYIKNSQAGSFTASELDRLANEYGKKAEIISDYVKLTK